MNLKHRESLFYLLLWILLVFWLRPWSGDLRSDPLTYACISKNMVENNNYLNPVLDGEPYLNKPPLYFWLVAISFKIFGINFYASKIPSLVIGTIDAFMLYYIVYRWTEKIDLSFLSSFVFITTRWIFRDFTTNRPESLLIFSILLGCYAIILMNEKNRYGYYLMGLSFFIGLMCKFLFAVFLPLTVSIYGIITRKIRDWLRTSHLYLLIFFTILISSLWFIYYESIHKGYIIYLFKQQVFQRIQEGGDVKKDSLMYFREFLLYYHPWLIILISGIPVILRKLRREDLVLFSFIGFFTIFILLQISAGKASRYLVSLTPFLSILVAISIINYDRLKNIILKGVRYLLLPFFIFFWIVPVRINPEKYQVIHLADRLSKEFTVDYRDPFASLRKAYEPRKDIRFVFWKGNAISKEQMRLWYFYLSDRFVLWDDNELLKWIEEGNHPIILLTDRNELGKLKQYGINWIEISRDRYNILLGGLKISPKAVQ